MIHAICGQFAQHLQRQYCEPMKLHTGDLTARNETRNGQTRFQRSQRRLDLGFKSVLPSCHYCDAHRAARHADRGTIRAGERPKGPRRLLNTR